MTSVRYDPAVPEMIFSGHAGAAEAGRDPVCAALSMLMFTLASEEAHSAPFSREKGKNAHPFPPSSLSPSKREGFAGGPGGANGTRELCVEIQDGYCRVCGGERAVYEVIAAGLRLLAAEYPEHVSLEVKT